jgi:uncharacterized protein YukE
MPAPFLHGSRPPEALADHITDLANAFSNVADVLSQQYITLNNATNGLLDGTYPWQGQGAVSFADTWQQFGKYMQQLQKTCEDIYNSLIRFSQRLSDIETEQAWDFLLAVAGGILTIISFAAMIAELGLNPFIDGFFASIATFTEQDGNDVVTLSEDITQTDREAATELQMIEEELASSPTLVGSSNTVASTSDAISPANLNEMMQAIDDETGLSNSNPDEFYARGGGKQFQFQNDAYFNSRPGMNKMPPGLNSPEAQYWMQQIENKGVNVVWDHDVQVKLLNKGGYGITYNYNDLNTPNRSAIYMVVGLSPDADATTVYEEYLHVTEAENRGWLPYNDYNTRLEENYAEEIRVEYQVMQKAQDLKMTRHMWNVLSANRRQYIQLLMGLNTPIPPDIQQYFNDPPMPSGLP